MSAPNGKSLPEFLVRWISLAVLLGGALWLGADIWKLQMQHDHEEKLAMLEMITCTRTDQE